LKEGPGDLLRLVREKLGLNARRAALRLTRRIFRRASLSRCDATCCKGGVSVSTLERDAIFAHREEVVLAMEASPRRGVAPRSAAWFSSRVKRDPDFLAGRSVDTSVVAGACVFLRDDRLCAVHVASDRAAGHPYVLKPAYCVLFPLAVERGALDVCRGSFTRRPRCCSPVRDGTATPLQIYAPALGTISSTPERPRPASAASARATETAVTSRR
jgi:Fe-S-cluster containining protein